VNALAWKWASLALNAALYGFASIALVGDSDLNLAELPLTIKRKGETSIKVTDVYTLRKLRLEGKLSIDDWRIIGPKTILERCADASYIDGKPLILTEDQEESISYLREELRNWYNHLKPDIGAAIITTGLPKMCKDVLKVIQFLIEEGISNHRWETEEQLQEIIGLCTVNLAIVEERMRQQDFQRENE